MTARDVPGSESGKGSPVMIVCPTPAPWTWVSGAPTLTPVPTSWVPALIETVSGPVAVSAAVIASAIVASGVPSAQGAGAQ